MSTVPEALAVFAAIDPLLLALIVALSAIGLACFALWAAVKLNSGGRER